MTTEQTNQEVAQTATEEVKDAPQFSEIEQRAMEMGWRPKEEFNGTEDDFIDAKEFVRRKPLFDKIENTSKELKAVRKALDALKTHYTTVQDSAYKQALARLEAAKAEAVTNSDGETFTKLTNQIDRVKEEHAKIEQVKQATNIPDDSSEVTHPEFQAWLSKNQWYQSMGDMRMWADKYGHDLYTRGTPREQVLKEIEKEVRKEFPRRFTNPNKVNAPDVDTGSKNSGRNKSADSFELTDQERQIMNTLIRSDPKLFTKEKYIAELKAAKGIK